MSNQPYISPLAKAASKIGISESAAVDIVARNHELESIIKKSNLRPINVSFDDKTKKWLNKVSKALNVSVNAIIYSALANATKAVIANSKK